MLQDRQCTYDVTLRRIRESLLPWKCNLSVCVCACVLTYVCGCPAALACVRVALLIKHATRMRHIVTSFVDPLPPPYFLL
jgi:hypothetical protein